MKDKMGNDLSAMQIASKAKKRVYWILLDFWLYILNRLAYDMPLHFVRRFFFTISGMKIGRSSFIHMWTRVYKPSGIEIGNGTIIGDHCFLDGRATLKIGDNVDIATGVLIYNSEHDVNSEDFSPIEQAVEIGDYVFIGPRAIILPGVKIGRGAIVAAGAVVTENVGDFEIVGGIPAKKVSDRKIKNPRYKLGRARLFQ